MSRYQETKSVFIGSSGMSLATAQALVAGVGEVLATGRNPALPNARSARRHR